MQRPGESALDGAMRPPEPSEGLGGRAGDPRGCGLREGARLWRCSLGPGLEELRRGGTTPVRRPVAEQPEAI